MRDLRKESGRKADMMERKALFDRITRYADAYQASYPKTAESDLKLVNAYCSGSSATHVALDHHCAESTVFRAISRVREFLQRQNYDERWKPLIQYIMEHSPDWVEAVWIRQMFVRYRYDFVAWWNSLPPEQQAEENARYIDDRSPMGPLYLDWLRKHAQPDGI